MNLDGNSTFTSKRKIQPLILVFFVSKTIVTACQLENIESRWESCATVYFPWKEKKLSSKL